MQVEYEVIYIDDSIDKRIMINQNTQRQYRVDLNHEIIN